MRQALEHANENTNNRAIPKPKRTPWERKIWYAWSCCARETIISANTEMTDPKGNMTCQTQLFPIRTLTFGSIVLLTDVPYASNIRPANVPTKYSRKTCREPMRDIDEDDEDGSSVVS